MAAVNNAAMNMGVQILLQDPASSSFEHISRRGVAGSYGSSTFNVEEPPHCFPRWLPFCIPTNCTEILIYTYPRRHLFSIVAFSSPGCSVVMCVRWSLTVVPTCLSLVSALLTASQAPAGHWRAFGDVSVEVRRTEVFKCGCLLL